MRQATLGVIGGTGLGEALVQDVGGETVDVDTPFGPPSGRFVLANWEGVDVAFLSRHGPGHCLNPTAVPYRANIWAMKTLGVSAVLASGATGSLREELKPGHLVLCDQIIDKTFRRDGTFFDSGLATHVELADPFCPWLRELLQRAAERVDATVHNAGTYVCMEGPQFSTRAESMMHRMWGGDLIGMTCMPEAKLAREAELCYALIAIPTDYDCWRPPQRHERPGALMEQIVANLKKGTQAAVSLIRAVLSEVRSLSERSCGCGSAMEPAIWSDPKKLTAEVRSRLAPLIGRYVGLPDPDGG